MQLEKLLNNTLNGIILDSDVIIELHQKNELNSVLTKLNNEDIKVYIPKNISTIDNFNGQLKSAVEAYLSTNYLMELLLKISESKVYKSLKELPFDVGELLVYTLAEEHKLLVISNDKIAAYSYLAYKNNDGLQYGNISSDELLENYYGENLNLITRRLSNYKFLQLLGYEASNIAKITKSNRRNKEWFTAKEIANENRKVLNKFTSEENFYISIGKLAASIYALDKTTNKNNFHEDKHYEKNIGLKIKSTSNDIKNTILTRQVERGNYTSWEYNNIAYNAIIKYMAHSPFLIPLLDSSVNNKYIGEISPEEFDSCISFTSKFRNLFDKYREKN